jgi:hypothetical protein
MGKELSVAPEGEESPSPSYRAFCATVRAQAGDAPSLRRGVRKAAAKKPRSTGRLPRTATKAAR